jgi:excisionase family DNA binding protein
MAQTTSDRLLLKVPEAAERLALGRATVYRLIEAGEIKVLHIGRAVRIPASELTRWLEKQTA